MLSVIYNSVRITLDSYEDGTGRWIAHVTLQVEGKGTPVALVAWPSVHASKWDADTAAFAWAKRQIRNNLWAQHAKESEVLRPALGEED